jgi:hypothetical protein
MQLALMQHHWLCVRSPVPDCSHGVLGNAFVRIVARLIETKIADDVRVYPHVAHVAACIQRAGFSSWALSFISAISEAAAVAAVDYMVGDEGTVDLHDILDLDWPKHVRKAAVKRAIELAYWDDDDLKDLGIDAEGNDLEVKEDGEKRQDDEDDEDEDDEDEDDEDEDEEEGAKQPAVKRARKAAAEDK